LQYLLRYLYTFTLSCLIKGVREVFLTSKYTLIVVALCTQQLVVEMVELFGMTHLGFAGIV